MLRVGSLVLAGALLGPGFALAGPTAGSDSASSFSLVVPAISGPYTDDSRDLRADSSLTGGKGVATLSAYAEVAPIPESETYAMFAAGLLGMGMILRRQRRE